jgi:hypothetical protein
MEKREEKLKTMLEVVNTVRAKTGQYLWFCCEGGQCADLLSPEDFEGDNDIRTEMDSDLTKIYLRMDEASLSHERPLDFFYTLFQKGGADVIQK